MGVSDSYKLPEDKAPARTVLGNGVPPPLAQAVIEPLLRDIKKPTRIIHALDDPFMYRHTVPGANELSSDIDFLLTRRGGHVGFISGKTPSTAYSWSTVKILEFLSM